MDLCSAIVYCTPPSLTTVSDWLPSVPGTEVHQTDRSGKIIITIEDIANPDNPQECLHKASESITQIQQNKNILSVMLISQFSDIDD